MPRNLPPDDVAGLCERLEVLALDFLEPDPTTGDVYDKDGRTIIDAAATLQSLAREVEELRTRAETCERFELRHRKQIDVLIGENRIRDIALTAAQAENERLRVAIKPFADVVDALDFYVEEAMPSEESLCFPRGDVRVCPDECGHKLISFDDFRAARASLERQTP